MTTPPPPRQNKEPLRPGEGYKMIHGVRIRCVVDQEKLDAHTQKLRGAIDKTAEETAARELRVGLEKDGTTGWSRFRRGTERLR